MSVVTSNTTKESFDGNGSTSTPYPLAIQRNSNADIYAMVDGEAFSNFTISEDGLRTGVAIPPGSVLTVYRATPQTQTNPFPSNTTPAPEDVRNSLNKITMIIQELSRVVGTPGMQALSFPLDEPAANNTTLPTPALRRDQVVYFDFFTGEMRLISMDAVASRVLEVYGLTISSEDVLSAISAISPLVRFSDPTTSSPGKTGQLTIVPSGVRMTVTGSLAPNAAGAYGAIGTGQTGRTTYATSHDENAFSPAGTSFTGGVLYYTTAWVLEYWDTGEKTGLWLGLNSADKPFPSSDGITWLPVESSGTPTIQAGEVGEGKIFANVANQLIGGPPEWVRLARASDGVLVANTAARLALSYEQAYGQVVVQEDGSGWYLVAFGDPANAADWIQIAAPTGSSNSFINATDYGVLPTNTAAQNDAAWAVLWAVAKAAKRSVHFDEPATYLFSTSITIDQSGVTLSGANREFTRLQWSGTSNGITIALGGDTSIWGNQTRRVTLLDLGIYGKASDALPLVGNGINIHDGSVDNVGGVLTGQAVVMNGCTVRNWDVGYWNRRCDQSSLIDCVIVYNRVGIDYHTSAHSLILTNTGVARQKQVGIIARSGSGNVITGGDFGNQPRDIEVHGPQPLTLIGSNHEQCLTVGDVTGTEFIRVENNARLTVIGIWFLKGNGLDVPRFRMMGSSTLNIHGYSDSGTFQTTQEDQSIVRSPVVYRETAGSIVVGLPSFAGLTEGVTVDSNTLVGETPVVFRHNAAPWKTIFSNSGLNAVGGAAIANNRTENDLFTVLPTAAGQPSHLIWHSPVDKKVHRLSGILFGAGSPANVISAKPGTLYINTSGGTGATLWVKESGDNNAVGWVAK